MPDDAMRRALLDRDGHYCRFCGVPVIRKEVRYHFQKLHPDLQLWGKRNVDQHAAFQALWAQYDHVVPHSRGGATDLDNLVVTCAPCNFARMELTIEEVGLEDPRARPPVRGAWTGLEEVLAASTGQELNHKKPRQEHPVRELNCGAQASAGGCDRL